jgi:O-antigen/teichoic acid export membrane protein
VLRWIAPEDLGEWQSFTVFVGYISILTLGVTSGLNRELPYWLGKGDEELAISRLKTAGAFITRLSLIIMGLVLIVSSTTYLLNWLSLNHSLMLFSAFSIGALAIQTNLLGATFRSDGAFRKLGFIQYGIAGFHLALLPIVYFYGIWGYIIYQSLNTLFLYWGYYYFRPYKVSYAFYKKQFKELVRIGFPMYFWNYIASVSRTIPRLTLVLFGSPFLVGLFAPAENINKAVLNLPTYINRYLFPKMSYNYGKFDEAKMIVKQTMKAGLLLFLSMSIIAVILVFAIPFIFEYLFPKYIEATQIVQIVLFSGVFYSINALFHNSINSLKLYRFFKVIIPLRIVFILLAIGISYLFVNELLLAVALGAVISEFLVMLNYLYFLKLKIK